MVDETVDLVAAADDSGKVRVADVQILSGEPTDEEIAAVVAALSALASKAQAPDLTPRNRYAEPIDKLRFRPESWQLVTLFQRTKLARRP